jgi:site-specific DNA recombinase
MNKINDDPVIVPIAQENFEPIIDEEMFYDTQNRLEERKKMAFRAKTHYPFSGIAICARCGYTMSGSSKRRKSGSIYRYYKCRGRFNFGTCDMPVVAEEAIEQTFLNTFEFTEPDQINVEDIVMDEAAVKKELERLNQRKERAEELYLDGDIDRHRYEAIKEDIKQSEQELLRMMRTNNEEASLDEIKAFLADIKKEWSNLTYEERQTAIQSIFKSITIEMIEPGTIGLNPKLPVLKITDYQLR